MNVKLLKIFVAMPGDVAAEFDIVEKVVNKINNHISGIYSIRFEIVRGLDATPSMGRPQGVILQQIKIEEFDYFIGLLWTRFGTPTGAKNDLNGRDYQSGTEEEFYTALKSRESKKKPEILIYNCKKNPDYDSLDLFQFQKVKEFLERLKPNGDHPGLFSTYLTKDEFEDKLYSHLLSLVKKDYHKENKSNSALANSIYLDGNLKAIFFPKNNDDRNNAKRNLLLSSKKVKLIAFSGHSYLALHGNRFFNEVNKLLDNGGEFHILLANQLTEVGLRIAHAELSIPYVSNNKIVRTTSGYHTSFRKALMGFNELRQNFGDQIKLRFTNEIITSTILLSESECFFEPYLYYGLRERMKKATINKH
jgi:hypothetical protein